MKKFAIGLSIFLVLVIGALLIGPSLIDWNRYTDEIAQQVEKITGRKVQIGGPVTVQVLPSPRLEVSDVHLANLSGSKDARMASLESLEVRVAAVPLLAGNIRVETVKLVRPRVLLERLADGRVNWDFSQVVPVKDATASAPAATDSKTSAGGGRTAAGPGIAVDNFAIVDGTVLYRDGQRGREETITGIDARIAAASLNGPVESEGALTLGGHRLAFSLNVAEIVQDRTVPLVFNLNLGKDTVIKVDGGVVNVTEKPRLRAKITGGGPNVARAISAAGGPADLPVNLAKPFSVQGNIEASVDGGRIDDLEIQFDKMDIKASAEIATGDKTVVALSVKSGWIDLDALLAPAPIVAAEGAKDGEGKPGKPAKAAKGATPAKTPATVSAASGFELPQNVQANLSVQVDSLVFQGKPLEGVTLSADLANGELTLNQVTAQLPGNADVGLFGFLSAKNGKPRFEGQIETRAKDLGGVVAWIMPDARLPAAVLKDFSFKTPLVIDGNYAQLTDINATAGGSRLTGAVTVAVQARPSFGANLTLDTVDLDALMPASDSPGAAQGAGAKTSAGGDSGSAGSNSKGAGAAAKTPSVNLFQPLKPLTQFDANVKLAVGAAKVRGLTARKLSLDATLVQGELTLRELNVGDIAGMSAGMSGGLAGLDGIPTAKDLKITASTKNLAPLVKAFALDLPVPAATVGAVSVNTTLSGSLLSPKVAADLGAMGGVVGVRGTLPVLALAGQDLRLGVSAQHSDLAGLLRRLGVDYRPQGKIGGLDLKAQVAGNAKSLRVDNIAGRVGPVATSGSLSLALDGAKPKALANLVLGAFDVTPFLPAKQSAGLFDRGWRIKRAPAAWAGPGGNPLLTTAAVNARWSKAPIDLSVLNTLDAAVTVASPKVTFDGASLENADLGAAVEGGVLTVERLTGRLFGGALTAKASASAAGQLSASGQLAGADLTQAGKALGSAAATGKANADFDFTAQGRSEAEIISSLGGKLNFVGRDLDAEAISGSADAGFGLGGLMLALNQLGGALGGPKQGKGVADVDAVFTVANGVATSQQLKAVTNIGVASGAGTIDLAGWTVNLSGAIQPAPSLLSAAFSIATRKGINVPFSVTGKLDAPRIKVDTSSMGTGGIPVPGLDKLLKKKGVGDVLQGILGGGQTQQQAPPESPSQTETAPESQEQKKSIKPQDLIRGILGKF